MNGCTCLTVISRVPFRASLIVPLGAVVGPCEPVPHRHDVVAVDHAERARRRALIPPDHHRELAVGAFHEAEAGHCARAISAPTETDEIV
jgi:hypothetical protein